MRFRLAVLMMALAFGPAMAADPPPDMKGMWLTTDYPSLQLRAGEDSTLPLSLYTYGLPPQRSNLSIADVPAGWTASIEGSGKPVSAAFTEYNGKASLNLKLTIPADTKPGEYKLTLNAAGEGANSALPIAINVAAPLAAKLTATPKFPSLKGTPKSSFDFSVSVKNESGSDMLVNLVADTPPGFTTTYKEGYATQEITSVAFKAGESKDISVSIKPSPIADAKKYPITVHFNGEKAEATAQLTMDVSGQPSITLTGQGERLSGDAYAGEERAIQLVVRNTGTAPARGVEISSTPPTGWKIDFNPKTVPEVAVGEEKQVVANVTPNPKAINGDYVLNIRASGDGISETANYRVTVMTSTLWGVTGIAVIAIALLVLVGAVGRFGRR